MGGWMEGEVRGGECETEVVSNEASLLEASAEQTLCAAPERANGKGI